MDQRRYLVDVSVPATAPDPVETLQRGWDEQVGGIMPIPPVTPPGEANDYRVRIVHSKIATAVVEDLYSDAIAGGTGGPYAHLNGRVVVHLVQRGEWKFAGAKDSETVSVSSGQFCVRYNDAPWQFEIRPATRAQVLILPSADLRSLIGDRAVMGSQETPEVRLLMAYLSMVRTTVNELSDAGAHAAGSALTELLKGVLSQRVVADELGLLPALVQAAKDVIDRRLLDPELAPGSLASELNVSLRSLHRAFATAEESVMSYIRSRRLERARQELADPPERPAISDLAARWHFSDGSHFSRTFRQQYGETPTEYALRTRNGDSSADE